MNFKSLAVLMFIAGSQGVKITEEGVFTGNIVDIKA